MAAPEEEDLRVGLVVREVAWVQALPHAIFVLLSEDLGCERPLLQQAAHQALEGRDRLPRAQGEAPADDHRHLKLGRLPRRELRAEEERSQVSRSHRPASQVTRSPSESHACHGLPVSPLAVRSPAPAASARKSPRASAGREETS